MLEQRLEQLVENTVVSLPEAHTGLVLVVLVGFSFSLSHVFSLLANRLKPRQILFHVLLDSLVLAAALLIASFINMVLIALHTQLLVEPKEFFNAIGGALAPGLFYVLVAGPYVSDLIAITIWVLIHLNVITLVHLFWTSLRRGVAAGHAWVCGGPGADCVAIPLQLAPQLRPPRF